MAPVIPHKRQSLAPTMPKGSISFILAITVAIAIALRLHHKRSSRRPTYNPTPFPSRAKVVAVAHNIADSPKRLRREDPLPTILDTASNRPHGYDPGLLESWAAQAPCKTSAKIFTEQPPISSGHMVQILSLPIQTVRRHSHPIGLDSERLKDMENRTGSSWRGKVSIEKNADGIDLQKRDIILERSGWKRHVKTWGGSVGHEF